MITVICPVYNEEKFIEGVIKSFLISYPKEKELLIIDGGSTDGTVDIVRNWYGKSKNIRLLDNPNRFVAFALNLAIKNSDGDPIIRLDAHTEYEKDYFEKILSTFDQTAADIVGGPMRAVGKTPFQKAVAYCTSTIFGIGDSKIHDENYKGESDHVYLGAWKRKLFDEIGYFDEQLKRNQDDEFHYRAKSMGKKIFLNPEIKSYYYPRYTWKSLIKQYFEYGLFKPIVLKKVKSEIKLRHLIPSLFLLYLFALIFISYLPLMIIPVIIYVVILLYFSIINKLEIVEKLLSLLVYPSVHISYGLGFLIGIKKLIKVSR